MFLSVSFLECAQGSDYYRFNNSFEVSHFQFEFQDPYVYSFCHILLEICLFNDTPTGIFVVFIQYV